MGPGVQSQPPMLQSSPVSRWVLGWEVSFDKVCQAGPLLLSAPTLAKYIVLIKCCFFI